MNREIKFRAKVYHNPQKVYLCSGCQDGEWVYGDLHLQSANPHIHIKEHHREPIDVETIGQFTGLYDKNGTPIYEGDIVDAWSAGQHTTCGIIRYKAPRFYIGLFNKQRNEYYDSWSLSPNAFGKDELLEVIGNIHDTEVIK